MTLSWSFPRLGENADEYMLLGAEALYDICVGALKLVTQSVDE